MTTIEIKHKIVEIVDTLPANTLETVYEILKRAQQQRDEVEDNYLAKILNEDFELLRKLAQ
ncbi:MAG: hypothetical protein Kapaf2KO_10900 [Candidatus Kapaibacteriales bacterium]